MRSESDGQPEAIATNLLTMASLKVPFVTIMVGEGGSGGKYYVFDLADCFRCFGHCYGRSYSNAIRRLLWCNYP